MTTLTALWRPLLATTLTLPTLSLAQRPASLPPALARFKRDFAVIRSSYENDHTGKFAYAFKSIPRLLAYLKTQDLSAADARRIGLGFTGSAGTGRLRIYTYAYESGGTRSTIHRSVFQWCNSAGRRFVYETYEEGVFDKIHPLSSPEHHYYLLLGGDDGDSNCYTNKAWVVELKGNYLLLDHPAFGRTKPLFELCNVPMTFDAGRQVLRLDLTHYSTEHDEVLLPEWGRPAGQRMMLKFSNGRFVRSR